MKYKILDIKWLTEGKFEETILVKANSIEQARFGISFVPYINEDTLW